MDFSLSPDLVALQQRVRAFISQTVIPAEPLDGPDGPPEEILSDLRTKAKEAGLFAPHLPIQHGGLGLGTLGMCAVFEEAGTSPLGPLALHCAAPDEGNMHLLLRAATPEQLAKYFAPLAQGAIRSCFALTEPHPGAGSDPAMIRTTAERAEGGWILSGRKWFTTGARGAAFAIVAAVTDPSANPRQGTSLFLVDATRGGYEVERMIDTMTEGTPGGHCEVRLSRCFVPDECVLGPLGAGFALMQQRLGPARLTHCMRWLGAARRALDTAVGYARKREAFGKRLADHQGVAFPLADCAIELHASRLMVLHAAWKLDQGDEARVETSMCKAFVAEAAGRVIDRCVQACGAWGIARESLLERLYRDVRAFRIYDGPSEVHRMVVARSLLAEGKKP
ncbi:MAG: acyl-CoA dehydrogenase family protein [Gemmataceae bacterium]|nr:acyl-CoA dehydrogenase family protein [Gemmataceae bacterium]